MAYMRDHVVVEMREERMKRVNAHVQRLHVRARVERIVRVENTLQRITLLLQRGSLGVVRGP